jgi:hypothetical protein
MLLETDPARDADAPGKPAGQRPRSALETELNQALDRLDHQVQDTKEYLASLDKQVPTEVATRKRRRATDRKPSEGPER